MRSNWVFILIVVSLNSAFGQHKSEEFDSADKLYDSKNYNRFILVKANTVFASAAKISDFGLLPQEGNVYEHIFHFGELSGWELIKVSDELDNVYFYNIAYWLLGFGEDDPNHADESVIILTDKKTNEVKYVGLVDPQLAGIDDSLLLMSDKNEQFVIDIPFHKFKIVEDAFECSVKAFLVRNSISADDLKDPLVLPIAIRFNEKTSR